MVQVAGITTESISVTGSDDGATAELLRLLVCEVPFVALYIRKSPS
jgi:hypothetical protein